jgi:SAM-dependent methyltransferase
VESAALRMSTVLDIGCGNAKTAGAVGIDANANTQADVIHDLDVFPWPLPSDQFERIVCNHIVEHVADMLRFMGEVHRVARAGALVSIVTPHFTNRSSFTDPTHRRHLTRRSFDYFLPPTPYPRPSFMQRALETKFEVPNFYTGTHFKITCAHMRLARPFRGLGIQWLANRFPDFYELYLAFMFPARDLYFTLQVLK